jgi:hypothetical protein
MLTYICSLPNEKKAGRIPQLISDDPAAIERFAQTWDRPGRGTFTCISPLQIGATRRLLEAVAALTCIHVDIDPRTLATAKENVLRTLQQLPLRAEIRDSGGGYHVIWHLKEPVPRDTAEFKRLNELRAKLRWILCGDPAPDHAAALLRKVGTHNSKYGAPRLVHVVQEAAPVDVLELEELVDTLGNASLFTPLPKGNGRDHSEETPPPAEKHTPVNIKKRLADMTFKGPGDSAIHVTQLQVTASSLRAGQCVDSVVEEVLEATRKAVTGNPKAANWNWDKEQRDIQKMCCDFINKNPELAALLPDKLFAAWQERLTNGRTHPRLVYASHIGWHIRSEQNGEQAQETTRSGNDGPANDKPRNKRGPFVLRPFVPFDLATLPPRQWLYGRHYQRGTVSATIAPGGFGKTTLCMVEAVAMATCRNLLGEQPTERLRAWYHNGEDTLEELNRRLGAICLHYRIDQEELRGWFFMTSGNEVPLRVATGYSELKIEQPLIECIAAEVRRNEIDVAVLDPLITLHAVPEGDNSKMDRVIRIFAGIADSEECAVELAHHTRKLPAGADGADYVASDIRGATATQDAVRAARMLNQMTEHDAEAAGIPEDERTSYFRVDKVKGNNSPAAKAVWRRFVNIDLPNTDEVGVVVPWDFPGQGAPSPEMAAAEQAAESMFMHLLTRFTLQGRAVSESAGSRYAPLLFSREAEAKAAKIGKEAMAAAMRRLFAKNRIRIETSGKGGHRAHRITTT